MTVEEALLAVVGLVAVVLLFLGLAQTLGGEQRTRRRARRRQLARPVSSRPIAEHGAARLSRQPLARRPAPLAARRTGPGDPVPPATEVTALPAPPRVPDPEALAWRERVAGHIRRREFGEARGLVDPALAAGAVTVDGAEFLLEVCSTAIARDLWRLRRALRRGAGDQTALSAALETTRVILESAPATGLDAGSRQRVGRRLWRGHTRLGLRRWRAGDFEAAVETLFHALSVPGIDERRRRLARDLLVRTLEDMAGQSLELIPQLRGEGDRAAALEQAQRVLEHIRRARADGIPAEDLAVAASRARQLLEHIETTSVQ